MLPSKLIALRTKVSGILVEVDKLVVPQSDASIDFYDEVQSFEISLVRWALEKASGSQRQAARLLNLNPTTLNTIMKRYGLMREKPSTTNLSRLEPFKKDNDSSITRLGEVSQR